MVVVLIHDGGIGLHLFFQEDGHIVACIDLSGQGESGPREDSYSMNMNAIEVAAVANALLHRHGASKVRKPILIGHSFGGWVALVAGALHGNELLGGIITLDSAIYPTTLERTDGPPPQSRKRKPGTKTIEDLKKRFRLMPPQPVVNQYLMDYIFPLSIKQNDDGSYRWKDDPNRMGKTRFSGLKIGEILNDENRKIMNEISSKRLRNMKTKRVAILYGELSNHSIPEVLEHMRSEANKFIAPGTPIVPIINSHHHVMFDQPLQVITSIRAILSEWERHDNNIIRKIQSKM